MPDFRIAYRPFAQQQAYFRRKVNVPSARWDDLQQAEHAHGFMAAGVTRADVLEDIRSAVQSAIDDGEGFEAFRARFNDILATRGWIGGAGDESDARRDWRMRTIYTTNLRTSYMAGRWEQLKAFPFLRYQHNTVNNPREDHLAWDGKVLATNDPWWNTHYPPNGWGCRCTVTGVGKGRLRALGKDGPDPTPAPSEGDPPPEWAYHPGKAARSLPAAESLGRKVMDMPPEWRKAVLDDAQRRNTEWFSDWPGFVRQVQTEIADGAARPQGAATPLGFLPSTVLDALASGRGLDGRAFAAVSPQTALVATTDRAVYHSLRDAKFADRPQLRDAFAQALTQAPEWIASADAVVWDSANRVLLFARRNDDGSYMAMVARIDLREGRAREPATAAWVRTFESYSRDALRQYALLAGNL